MSKQKLPENPAYNQLLASIGNAIEEGRSNALAAVNLYLLRSYWLIGRHIVEFEQHGNERAEYGSKLLVGLARDLRTRYGKGFSKSNIYNMRQFFLLWPDFQAAANSEQSKFQTSGTSEIFQTSGKLTWSHYCELMGVTNAHARSFYEKQTQLENWSVRSLKRHIKSGLFERLALSQDKTGVLKLAAEGNVITNPIDAIRDPYIFEFLDIPQQAIVTEADLESSLLQNLQAFIMELGKGFSFVARQHRITIDNDHFYVDLVFYHRILKCFVLIDLKIGKVKHQDIGQLNLYLNYFAEEENCADDNPPIGIIIGGDKNDLLVKYATGGLSTQIFVSKYQLYLPEKQQLENMVRHVLETENPS